MEGLQFQNFWDKSKTFLHDPESLVVLLVRISHGNLKSLDDFEDLVLDVPVKAVSVVVEDPCGLETPALVGRLKH